MATAREIETAALSDWIKICDAIDDGFLDDGLDEIARAVNGRRDVAARRKARRMVQHLQVGDKVMLTNGIKPRYMEGVTGAILELRDGGALVKLNEIPSHRGRPSAAGVQKKVIVPFIHLRQINSDEETLAEQDDEDLIGDDSEEDDD